MIRDMVITGASWGSSQEVSEQRRARLLHFPTIPSPFLEKMEQSRDVFLQEIVQDIEELQEAGLDIVAVEFSRGYEAAVHELLAWVRHPSFDEEALKMVVDLVEDSESQSLVLNSFMRHPDSMAVLRETVSFIRDQPYDSRMALRYDGEYGGPRLILDVRTSTKVSDSSYQKATGDFWTWWESQGFSNSDIDLLVSLK